MSFTYDPNLLLPLDQLRFLLADTSEDGAYFADSELMALLAMADGEIYGAAARAARSLVARFGRMTKITTGGLTLDYGERVKFYAAMALDMDAKAASSVGGVIGGAVVTGLSIGLMTDAQYDRDRPPSRFVMGSDDGIGALGPREAIGQ